jgi:hypothetical protein
MIPALVKTVERSPAFPCTERLTKRRNALLLRVGMNVKGWQGSEAPS